MWLSPGTNSAWSTSLTKASCSTGLCRLRYSLSGTNSAWSTSLTKASCSTGLCRLRDSLRRCGSHLEQIQHDQQAWPKLHVQLASAGWGTAWVEQIWLDQQAWPELHFRLVSAGWGRAWGDVVLTWNKFCFINKLDQSFVFNWPLQAEWQPEEMWFSPGTNSAWSTSLTKASFSTGLCRLRDSLRRCGSHLEQIQHDQQAWPKLHVQLASAGRGTAWGDVVLTWNKFGLINKLDQSFMFNWPLQAEGQPEEMWFSPGTNSALSISLTKAALPTCLCKLRHSLRKGHGVWGSNIVFGQVLAWGASRRQSRCRWVESITNLKASECSKHVGWQDWSSFEKQRYNKVITLSLSTASKWNLTAPPFRVGFAKEIFQRQVEIVWPC